MDQPRDGRGQWATDGGDESTATPNPDLVLTAYSQAALSKNPNSIDMSDITDERKKPVLFTDDHGHPILDSKNQPIWRPKDLPPSLFVDGGRVAPGVGQMTVDLFQFRQGQPWDAQRVDGKNVPQYVDYATIAIGLYCVVARMPREKCLNLQNTYASRNSEFKDDPKTRDPRWPSLPLRNVQNTELGYRLYETGRIAGTRDGHFD